MTDKSHDCDRDVRRSIQTLMSNEVASRPRQSAPGEVCTAILSGATLGEGPVWSAADQQLFWVDTLAPAIHRSDPISGKTETLALTELISALVLREGGGLVAAMQGGYKSVDFASGKVATISSPEADLRGNRFNDGSCDSRGRFWAGTLALDLTPSAGTLYRLDPDGSVHVMERGVHMPNGLGWSPDDRLFYFTDTAVRRIFVYDFDADSGSIRNKRVFAEVPEENIAPDGLAVDAEGFVWSAQWNGWRVVRYDPRGRVDRMLALPVPRPTNCVFGGTDFSTLYVTSASFGLSAGQLAESPLSGSVLSVDVGVKGLPAPPFKG